MASPKMSIVPNLFPVGLDAQVNGSWSSDLFVVHKDATTATSDPDDPNAIRVSSSVETNCIPIPGSHARRLNLFLMCGHASSTPEIGNPAVVTCFGRKKPASSQLHRSQPYEISQSVFDQLPINDDVASVIGNGFYIPLYKYDDQSGHEQTFTSPAELVQNVNKQFLIAGGVSYVINDTDDLILTVKTPVTGTNISAAVILGQLVFSA